MNLLKRLFVEEEGQGLVEYALIIGLISLVAVAAISAAGGSIGKIWTKIQTELGNVPAAK